jgi:two-component system response regulator YesN
LLIVDDEPLILAGLCSILNKTETGFQQVETANDSVEALKMLAGFKPHLVIADINMPEMNGLELIKLAKEKNLCHRFIILSGYDDFEYARQALRYHVIDYLMKPIDKVEFISTLKKVAREIVYENMPPVDDMDTDKEENESLGLLDGSKLSYQIKKTLDYIHQHYNWNISLNEIAEYIQLSPSYISATFKKETGVNLIHYLHSCRVVKALQLMKEQPKLPMSKVAYQVGYENPRHFYRVFKKYLGMTPGEFRKSGIAYEKVKETLEYITENKQNKNNFF